MMELRKIDKHKYAGFESMMNNKKRVWPHEVMGKIGIDEDEYNFYLSHYFSIKDKRERAKKPKKIEPVKVEIKRQNIPDGFLPWVSKILRVS